MSERILVIGPAWVGDMVMAQSLCKALRARFVDAVIDVLAPHWSLPLLARMAEVRRAIELPIGHGQFGLLTRYRLARALRGEHYSRAIILPRSFKAALIPWFARIPIRTGYRGEMRYGLINDIRPLDRSRLRQTVQRFVALGIAREQPLPPPILRPTLLIDQTRQQQIVERLGLSLSRPVIGLLPGAEYGPAKQWPAAHFAQLARTLHTLGQQLWLIGSARDHAIAETIRNACDGIAINLCGKTTLQEAIDLIALCRAVVTNDSGLMHIAAAVDTRVVALYGSSTPDYTPPLSDRATSLTLRLECSPCFRRHCPLGTTACLHGISPGQVNDALFNLIPPP
jgi:heptosyltransferase II